MIGPKVDDKTPQSPYQPDTEERNFVAKIKQDYAQAYANYTKSWVEFNDRSLRQVQDDDQKAWNSYVPPKSTDPDQKWRWHGIKPVTRNKLLTIAAHMTAALLYPNVSPQDQYDDHDKEVAQVMKDLMSWNMANSDYESVMLFGVIGALINPAVIAHVEYVEAISNVKVRKSDGSVEKVKVLDEVSSGFQIHLVPIDELLLENFYQYNLQHQRFLIRRRFIGYEDARAVFEFHPNWKFVRPGVRVLYQEENGGFYDQVDPELSGTLVEHCVYYNRAEDIEVSFLNGVYFGEPSISANPMRHRRLAMASDGSVVSVPIYPFAKGGHEPIDERRFTYYKSAASKFSPEQAVVNTLYRMVIDGTMYSVMPTLITSGAGKLDQGLVIPGRQIELGPDATVTPLQLGSNLVAGWNAVSKIEDSITQSSQADIRQGVPEQGQKTAFEVRRLEENARVSLGIFGRMIGEFVVDVGELMLDVIIQHETVAELGDKVGEDRYRSFLLPNSSDGGKNVTKKIIFTDKFLGKKFTDAEIERQSFRLLKEGGGIDSELRIYEVNPELFRRRKFLLTVKPDQMLPKSEAFERAMKLEAFAMMANDPYFDPVTVRRDFLLEPFVGGESDRYLRKPDQASAAIQQQQQTKIPDGGGKTSLAASGAVRSNTIQSGVSV